MLDEKDRKILAVLQSNARASIAEISRATGLKKDSIQYRMKRLERENKITYSVRIHAHATLTNIVSIQLNALTPGSEKVLDAYLHQFPEITRVFKTSGKYDYLITVKTENMKQFNDVLMKLRAKFNGSIQQFDITAVVEDVK